jgi:hypothetical protein
MFYPPPPVGAQYIAPHLAEAPARFPRLLYGYGFLGLSLEGIAPCFHPPDARPPAPSFRAKWADAFSFIIAPAMISAHAARNLSYSFFSSPLVTRHFLPKGIVILSAAKDPGLISPNLATICNYAAHALSAPAYR